MQPVPPSSSVPAVGARPVVLTAICGVGWLVAALRIASGFSPDARAYAAAHGVPGWIPFWVAATAALSAVSLWGIWRMRRVGVLGFIVATALENLVILLAAHRFWAPEFLLFPTLATLASLALLHRMPLRSPVA